MQVKEDRGIRRETLMGCDCWPANDVEPEEREAASDGVEPFLVTGGDRLAGAADARQG